LAREVSAVETEYKGNTYRSRTEARWAVFFDALGLTFGYERKLIELSTGEKYLPDFYIDDFEAYFEVKPSNENIVTDECVKARQLAADIDPARVWLAMGAPAANTPNILPLNQWPLETEIGDILSTMENRYFFLEDRRDDHVYWLQANIVDSDYFRETYMVGGPGVSTDHDRPPIMPAQY
jgi:hypothetical protein